MDDSNNQICKNCKFGTEIVKPSIYKCKRNGVTKKYDDWCEYFEIDKIKENPIIDFFNENIFKGK